MLLSCKCSQEPHPEPPLRSTVPLQHESGPSFCQIRISRLLLTVAQPRLFWSLSFVAVNPHDLWSYCLERIILSKLLWDLVAGLPSLASRVPGREAQILPWADFFQGMLPGVEVPTASWVMPQAPAGLHWGFHRLSCWEQSLFDEGTLLREGQSETNLKSLTSASMEKSDENKVENT